MRNLVLTILFVLSSTLAYAAENSIQPLKSASTGNVICTSFSINDLKHYWLTALHCVTNEDGTQNMPHVGDSGERATAVALFPDVDLAIIKSDISAPALGLQLVAPKRHDPVYVEGFGFGFEPPVDFWGYVSTVIQVEKRKWQLFDMHIWPGHSGSPIMNGVTGKVISVGQISVEGIAGGVTWEDLIKRAGKYWGK